MLRPEEVKAGIAPINDEQLRLSGEREAFNRQLMLHASKLKVGKERLNAIAASIALPIAHPMWEVADDGSLSMPEGVYGMYDFKPIPHDKVKALAGLAVELGCKPGVEAVREAIYKERRKVILSVCESITVSKAEGLTIKWALNLPVSDDGGLVDTGEGPDHG
ncbi:MAG: hypothetical protein NTY23_04185 [Chloroflexi bacterium]|nr:hypothetical protein [Chloroflexota bacterium]